MNNPIFISSKKRKFDEFSCELKQETPLAEDPLPHRHSQELKPPANLLPSTEELRISSTLSDPVIVKIEEEIMKRH